MDPAQLKQQAAMMRSMDPASIRRMNPMMANMTDEQIKAAADQMEMMASNPSMVKMAAEQMKSMSADDLEELKKMQGQLGGAGAGGPGMAGGPNLANMDPSTIMENIDSEQMKKMVGMMKKNPEMMKQAMKSNPAMANMDEKQLDQAINMFTNMDDVQLERALGWMKRVQTVTAPVTNAYKKANSLVGGQLPKIILVLVIVGFVLILKGLGWISFGEDKIASSSADLNSLLEETEVTPQQAYTAGQDEFGEEF